MLKLVVFALCACLSLQASVSSEWEKPEFCNTNDCPRFTVVRSDAEHELREYEQSTWVSTQEEAAEFDDLEGSLFRRLFLYISGQNENNEEIEMTTPVPTKIIPGSGPNCKSEFKQSFYLPYDKQSNPPAPSDSTVFLETTPRHRMYVRSFKTNGYATEQDYIDNILALATAIGNPDLYRIDYYYIVGYNSPYTIFNRHNEVWFDAVPQE